MNRSPWTAVFWTVLLLVGTTLSSYVPWNRVAPPLMNVASLATTRELARLDAFMAERRFVMALAATSRPALPRISVSTLVVAGTAVAGLIALLVVLTVRARRQRLRVLRMAQRGDPMNEIARDTRMSQDAVRLLLSPMIDPSRARVRSGKTFPT